MVDRAAQRQTEGQGNGSGLLTSVLPRQLWRPPATRTAVSLLSKIKGQAGLMLRHPKQLSEWYEQFTRRLQPWSGWSQMLMTLRSEAHPLGKETRIIEGQKENPKFQISNPAAPIQDLTTAQQRQVEPLPSRPAVRLAILRATPKTLGTAPRREVNQPLGLPLIPGNLFSPASREEQAPTHFRLLLSVSPTPRQEIRGGFPHQASPLIGLPIVEPTQTESALMESAPSLTPSQPVTTAPDYLLATPGAIAKLIEQTILPAQLPGLQLRLVSPEKQATVSYHPPAPANGRQPTADGSPPPVPVTASPPTPQLDINAVADKVYQTLMRRQQFERERRGLY